MKVLSTQDIAEVLSPRVSMESHNVVQGLNAAVDLFHEKLREGQGVRLGSLAEIQVQDSEGRVSGESLQVPSEEAAEALIDSMSVSPEEAQAFLTEMVSVLGDTLLQGDRVEIERFLSLSIAEQKASVTTNDQGGRVLTPARKVLSFHLDPELKAKVGEARRINFMPDPGFRDRIARLKASKILLVLPEEDFFVKTLQFHFERAGWEILVCSDIEKALEVVEGGETYQVILDDPMPDSQKLVERLKCNLDTARVPVITMLPSGADPNKTDSFAISPDQAVVQPFEVKALLDKAENELARGAEEDAIFRQEVLFRFATIDKMIDRANEMGGKLFERSGLDDEAQVALCAAFREAIGNAAQHGNRHRRDKVIEVLYLLDNEKITINVTDQGKGFEHRLYTQRGAGGNALAAARERHAQGRLGGLGIMLMLKCTDKLEYNEEGNSVTLTKMLTGGADS